METTELPLPTPAERSRTEMCTSNIRDTADQQPQLLSFELHPPGFAEALPAMGPSQSKTEYNRDTEAEDPGLL